MFRVQMFRLHAIEGLESGENCFTSTLVTVYGRVYANEFSGTDVLSPRCNDIVSGGGNVGA